MPIINIQKSTFTNNIKKYANSRLFRMTSPRLSKFLKSICEDIQNDIYNDEPEFKQLLSRVNFKMCSLFECIMIYELLKIFYARNEDKEQSGGKSNKVSFSDKKPENIGHVREVLTNLQNPTIYTKLESAIHHRFFGGTTPEQWKKAMKKFKKLAMKGDLEAKDSREYDLDELEKKHQKIERVNRKKRNGEEKKKLTQSQKRQYIMLKFKKLNTKLEKGQQLTPEEIKKYEKLKNWIEIQKAKEEFTNLNTKLRSETELTEIEKKRYNELADSIETLTAKAEELRSSASKKTTSQQTSKASTQTSGWVRGVLKKNPAETISKKTARTTTRTRGGVARRSKPITKKHSSTPSAKSNSSVRWDDLKATTEGESPAMRAARGDDDTN